MGHKAYQHHTFTAALMLLALAQFVVTGLLPLSSNAYFIAGAHGLLSLPMPMYALRVTGLLGRECDRVLHTTTEIAQRCDAVRGCRCSAAGSHACHDGCGEDVWPHHCGAPVSSQHFFIACNMCSACRLQLGSVAERYALHVRAVCPAAVYAGRAGPGAGGHAQVQRKHRQELRVVLRRGLRAHALVVLSVRAGAAAGA